MPQKIESEKKEARPQTEKRLIKIDGGRKKILTWFYLHHVPTFQTWGINFSISESSANNIFRALDRYSQRITTSKFIRTSQKQRKWIGMGQGNININRIDSW